MVFDVPVVQSEGELIKIAVQVLRAGVVIDANEPAFQDCPNALNPVGMDRATAKDASAVIAGAMPIEQTVQAGVRGVLIRVDGRADFNVIEDSLLDGSEIDSPDDKGFGVAVPLAYSKHGLFSDRSPSLMQFLLGVLVAFLAAYKRFIGFDGPAQLVDIGPASFAQPVKHKPRRLLSNANFLRKLHRTNALASGHKQVHREYPLVQRDMGALKDGASSDGEINLASVTAAEAALADRDSLSVSAVGTQHAVRPQPSLKVETGRCLIGEQFKELKNAYGALAHRLNIPQISQGSQVYNSQI